MKYAFDLEIFCNFFSATFINVADEFDDNTFVIFEDRNDTEQIKAFINQHITLIGYNNLHFDNILLNALLEGYSLDQLFTLAHDIILGDRNRETISSLRWRKVPYQSIDLKEMVGLDIGLKQACVVLEWDKVQDLPVSPESTIIAGDVPMILSYNRNDVLPLIKMYHGLEQEIALRERVNEIYNVNVTSTSEGQIPNVIFEKLLDSAVPVKQLREGRTRRSSIPLESCIGKNISFQTQTFLRFLDEVKKIDLVNGFKEELSFDNLVFNLGVGGLHTQDRPGTFYSDDFHLIIDVDVSSFYPSIILQNQIKPQHLPDQFLDIYQQMVKDRIKAKSNGDKVKADILKISINAVFGKMGNPDYWFYDPWAFYSVTISGQLYLLSLIEFLILKGFEVISANTDGVIAKVARGREKEYYECCQQWAKQVGLDLEFSTYDRYVRRDVNSYIAIGKSIKKKGIFETKKDTPLYRRLMKSYTPDIIPQALTNYFVHDIPVMQTIGQSRNIFDFLMSHRIKKNFKVIYRTGDWEKELQRTNRYYASYRGGIILKKDRFIKKDGNGKIIKDIDREISLLAGAGVSILNDVDRNQPFESYGVNLDYYRQEVEKVVNIIEPQVKQMVMF